MQDLKAQAREVVARLKKERPEDAKILGDFIGAMVHKDVVALGAGEAFALTDDTGRITATRKVVTLTAENGGLTQPVWAGPFVISAPGYTMLAEAAGAVVMNAQTVIVDGVMQQNPFVRRNAKGNIVDVYCRAIAFKYNDQGQPHVSDRTTIFDLGTYALADMIGKAKKTPQAFALLPAGMEPNQSQDACWAKYEVDDAVNLWLNVTHEEARAFLGQVINRQKKALEFAQTFAQRNALKHLFGIAVVPGQGTGRDCRPINYWDVPVTCWRPQDGGMVRFDAAKYAKASVVIESISMGNTMTALETGQRGVTLTMPNRSPETVTMSRGVDIVEAAENAEATMGDPEDQDYAAQGQEEDDGPAHPTATPPASQSQARPSQQPLPPQAAESQAPPRTPEQERDWKNYQRAKQDFPSEHEEALSRLFMEAGDVTPDNASKVVSLMNSILDESSSDEGEEG